MKIKRIIIDNFRAFKHAEFELNDFNCIIGKNDSGKSTIFAALEWFFSNDKELNNYDINSNIEYEKEDISVELYFSEATFKSEFIGEEFLDAEGYVCIKKGLTNPKSFDSNFVKPTPYYSLRIFKFKERKDRRILSFCKCEDLMKECFDLGINKDFLKGQISLFETCRDESSKTLFRSRNAFLIPQMRQTLYKYYSKFYNQVIEDERRFSESEWFEWKIKLSNFWVPPFMLFTPQTPINEYLNRLFNNIFSIFDNKKTEEIAKKISNAIKSNKSDTKDNISIEMFNKYFDCNFFPIDTYIPIVTTKNLEMIPLQNRGDGFQQKVKNAVFRLFTEQEHEHYCIFAFEEPETRLHPSAQIEMYKTIKSLSKISNYQVFMTTHSPYIVKELAKDNKPIVIKRDEQNNKSYKSDFEEQVLAHDDYVSMNEINYIAFEEPTIEYHIELFNFIQQKVKCTIDGVDKWLFVNKFADRINDFYFVNPDTGQLIPNEKKGGFQHAPKTLPYCVRNQIDHPHEKNYQYEDRNFIQQSIDIMRNAIINNPNVFK